MIEQTGESYTSSKYGKGLFVSESKSGKTTYLIASSLGVSPGQKMGGVVTAPKDLHVITFDSSAAAGISDFLVKTCNAPREALGFNVYNFQDDARRVAEGDGDYNHALFQSLLETRDRIGSKVQQSRGTSVVLVSSLTGLALAIERAILGKPGNSHNGKGYGDQSKWKMLSAQLFELQNLFQIDNWHCFWEAHLYKPPKTGQGGNNDFTEQPKEGIQVSGKAGATWAYNVEQVFRLRRSFGQKVPGTQCDITYLETRPTLDFIAAGRGFTERLEPKEYDLTSTLHKLGLKVGAWGAKSSAPKAVAAVKK